MQLSGNKVRKLEFLMADAVANGADCIITIGGIQSNHCRATAVAAKYLNLDCYLILRTSKVISSSSSIFLPVYCLFFIYLILASLVEAWAAIPTPTCNLRLVSPFKPITDVQLAFIFNIVSVVVCLRFFFWMSCRFLWTKILD